jgi:transposase
MLTKEIFVEIHALHRQGYGVKAIARKLGISKNTASAPLFLRKLVLGIPAQASDKNHVAVNAYGG